MICKVCKKEFEPKKRLRNFCSMFCKMAYISRHQNLSKRSEKEICPYCGVLAGKMHKYYCEKNPNKQIPPFTGKHHSEKMREHLSEERIKWLKENQTSILNAYVKRWKRIPSYPEKWFMKVIENEFQDKNYISEMRFGKYALDFAWPEKKKCIEIDSELHKGRELKDEEKNVFLEQNGWKIKRVWWKNIFKNTQNYIKELKEFIDNS
jgi:very-short-patch-repair endonuclease